MEPLPSESNKVVVSLYSDSISSRSDAGNKPSDGTRSSTLVAQSVHGARHRTDKPVSGDKLATADPPATADTVLFAEDLSVGDRWTTQSRRISESDVGEFSNLTGDHTPLHGTGNGDSPFGKPIVHGLLGLSVLAGLGSTYPNASTLALVGIEDWKFVAPVYLGDVVRARNEIVEIQPHGRRAVRVKWLRQLINESGRVLQEGFFVTLVASRSRAMARPR